MDVYLKLNLLAKRNSIFSNFNSNDYDEDDDDHLH